MATIGAEPWKAGTMKISLWVLVPESFHKKSANLKKWATLAHKQYSVLERKTKKATVGNKTGASQSHANAR